MMTARLTMSLSVLGNRARRKESSLLLIRLVIKKEIEGYYETKG